MNGMICPVCKSQKDRVFNVKRGNGKIVRRRECMDCKTKYSTLETIQFESISIPEATD